MFRLSPHNAYHRKRNFVAALNIMYYLRVRQKYRLDLEPTYTAIVYENFETKKDWVEFYGYVKEAIPPNAPMHPGKSIDL